MSGSAELPFDGLARDTFPPFPRIPCIVQPAQDPCSNPPTAPTQPSSEPLSIKRCTTAHALSHPTNPRSLFDPRSVRGFPYSYSRQLRRPGRRPSRRTESRCPQPRPPGCPQSRPRPLNGVTIIPALSNGRIASMMAEGRLCSLAMPAKVFSVLRDTAEAWSSSMVED